MATKPIEIVDCTLRDGEQTPGVWFTVQEKIQIARALDRAGVSVLDAGFPAASGDDVEAMQELSRLGLRTRLAATARPVRRDIAAAVQARADEVFVFLPVSDQHLKTKLLMSRERSAQMLERGLDQALAAGLGVSFVAEDASRADVDWLCTVVERAMHFSLERVVLCDTVGASLPAHIQSLVRSLLPLVSQEVPLCLHCHNDFGMATANTVAGVAAGARSVSCTVNGIGERAGNADLAEVCAAIAHLLDDEVDVKPTLLPALAALVEAASGVHNSPLKPVTGWNVYAHESGVHVDGMLKDARNYQRLPASWTAATSRFVLGKHSGSRLLRQLLEEEGVDVTKVDVDRLLTMLKDCATARSKERHREAYHAARDFRETALAGIERDEMRRLLERLTREGRAGVDRPTVKGPASLTGRS